MKYDIVPAFAARDLDTALRVRSGNAFADFSMMATLLIVAIGGNYG